MRNSLFVVFPRLSLLFLFSFLLSNITNPITKSTALAFNDKRVSMRLIHRNSLVPNSNVSDHASFAMRSSMARYAYLKAKANGNFLSVEDIRADLIPGKDENIFFVNISIGTPPIPQLVIMDTGSDLFWIQCEPCRQCERTPNPIYDPRKSSSYFNSSCQLSYCSKSIRGLCDANGQCAYALKYRGMAYSVGVLGYENVTLQTSDEGTVAIPFVVFGCGKNNYKPQAPQSSGVFGLSADDSSILRSSFCPKFSYCIGNVSDPDYAYNQLVLCDGAILQGLSTPIEIRDGLYYVSLEGIKVGLTELKINPEEYNFSVIVDSGATFTYLHRSTFDLLKMEAQNQLDQHLQRVKEANPDKLCYLGDLQRDVVSKNGTFPVVTFRLAKGALIDVDVEGLFYQRSTSDFCMAVVPTDNNLAVIGILAQQYHNLGFDLNARTLYLQGLDCRSLQS